MEGMLRIYIQEKPSEEENLRALDYLLFYADTARRIWSQQNIKSLRKKKKGKCAV